MADSFADLWASSAPAKQTQKSKPLGVSLSKKPTSSVQRSQWDAFSALSASQPTSRIHSPHFARTQALTKNASDSQTQGEADAFSELLDASSGFGGGTADGAFSNMSMAERAALVHKAALQRPQQGQTMSAAWNDIDALSQVGTFHTPAVAQSTAGDDFALEFGSAQLDQAKYDSETAKTACPSSARSTQMYQPQTTQARPASLWDLDEFASNLPSDTQQSELGSARTNTKSADCNDGSVLLDRDTQDDILGDLGKPANDYSRDFASASSPAQPPTRTQTTSPPPHITGQLVEMGFAPQLARKALVSTSTADGFDVQGALDWLLAHSAARSPEPSSIPGRSQNRERGQNGVRGTAIRTPNHSHTQAPQMNPEMVDLPTSTEKLLSHASEIGRGMFSRANTLFKEGRERAMKMYEERTGVNADSRPIPGRDGKAEGRPRWMKDSAVEGTIPKVRPPDGFKDDDGEARISDAQLTRTSQKSLPDESQLKPSPPLQELDLLGVDSSAEVYQSPFRRKPATPLVPDAGSVLPHDTRPTIPSKLTASIPCDTFAEYSSRKTTGTDAYKLGQYSAAVEAYSRALRLLPEGHPLRLPLLTNRAASQSKVGELRGAAEDCSDAILLVEKLVGSIGNSPLAMGRVWIQFEGSIQAGSNDGAEVDLAGGLTKAYHRRAEAYEGLEKWTEALADWETLSSAEWSGTTRVMAFSGMTRCRKMHDGSSDALTYSGLCQATPSSLVHQSPVKHRPRAPPCTASLAGEVEESPGVTALRTAATLAASEEVERLALKDAVDARLAVWRKGKESNIRALLASLDAVLWPELGWKKVGMAEVVGKGQVKVVYMRAIARLHPDKLNASNTTVEQRMIANGVFGTLNEAWNASQS